MTTAYYVSSTGSNTSPYDTWAKAATSLVVVTAVDVDDAVIYVDSGHTETTAGFLTFALAGTWTTPTKVISANAGAEPPTATLAGAVISNSDSALILNGCYLYKKLRFNVGTNGGSLTSAYFACGSSTNTNAMVLEDCSVYLSSTNVAACVVIGLTNSNSSSGLVVLNNVSISFGSTGASYKMLAGQLIVRGGGLDAGSAEIADVLLMTNGNHKSNVLFDGVDLSAASSTANLVKSPGLGSRVILRNCKLPASWTGALVVSMNTAAVVEMHNCDSAGTNYRLWVECFAGTVKSETTIVRTGGASDGITPLAWKLTSNTYASLVSNVVTPEIHIWNDTTGSSKTATIEIIYDGATDLLDDEVWMELEYFNDASFPLAASITDRKTELLATGADQGTSSETWTTTGLSSPNTQKLEVTFTPQMAGYIRARVVLAKASTTIYVDPVITIT